MSTERRPYNPSDVKLFANDLGVKTEGMESRQVSQKLAEIAYQRRARELSAPAETTQNSLEAGRFLLEVADQIVRPGKTHISPIIRYLEQTQVQELRLSDFPFFQEASKRAKDLKRLAGNPNLWKTGEQFETEFKSALDEVTSLLDQQDTAGFKREEQALSLEKIEQIRQLLFRIYFVGAKKFSTKLFFAPDWFWPVTWSDNPTFQDAKESNQILQLWQTLDKQPTTYQAFCDLSDMYCKWLGAKIQWLTFTSPQCEFFRPYFHQRFTNWGKPARGIK